MLWDVRIANGNRYISDIGTIKILLYRWGSDRSQLKLEHSASKNGGFQPISKPC